MKHAVFLLLGAILFAIAYAQAPLYYSNQNQYFLHGLAQGGAGHLSEDWLANTADPTPAFTSLVAATVGVGHEWLFHAYYLLLLGVYLAALVGIASVVGGPKWSSLHACTFAVGLIVLHSALLRWTSYRLLGLDYPWYLQAGLAGQYLLGPVLQPSAFGVFLLLSLWAFGADRPYLAAALAALTAGCHATYLLATGALTLGYMVAAWREGKPRQALQLAVLMGLLVIPVVAYNLAHFRPTSSESFAEAQRLLVELRLPHHSVVSRWWDTISALQVAWVVLGLSLARHHRLFIVLIVVSSVSVVLTGVQLATGSNTLALLFPWRLSTLLVPTATAIVLVRAIQWVLSRLESWPPGRVRWLWAANAIAASAAVVGGAIIMATGAGFRIGGGEEQAMLDFIRKNAAPGQVYSLPVNLPRPAPLPAAVPLNNNIDFRPPPKPDPSNRVVPFELQRFRLYTGVPIYVDFKSIPYQDAEVLEWHRRVLHNQEVYDLIQRGDVKKAQDSLRESGVTHLIVPAASDLCHSGFEAVFADEYYRVYRLVR